MSKSLLIWSIQWKSKANSIGHCASREAKWLEAFSIAAHWQALCTHSYPFSFHKMAYFHFWNGSPVGAPGCCGERQGEAQLVDSHWAPRGPQLPLAAVRRRGQGFIVPLSISACRLYSYEHAISLCSCTRELELYHSLWFSIWLL